MRAQRRHNPSRHAIRAGLLAAGLLLHAGMVRAQDPTALDPVVVTATRMPQPQLDVPASISRIDADRIGAATPGVNLSEVLKAVPGVLARDRQNYAQDLQISIRGFGTRAPFGIVGARLLVDGVPATMPDGAGQVSHFNLNSAGHIEVLRGPYSALYGNAAGGVIQIFTEEGAAGSEASFEAVGGSYGTARASLNARGAGGALDYNLDLTGFRSDGYRRHSRAERGSANARLGWRFAPEARLSLLANHLSLPEAQDPLGLTRAEFEADPRQSSANAEAFNTRKSVDQSQAGSSLDLPLGAAHALQLSGYLGRREVEQFLAIPPAAQASATHAGGVVDLDNAYRGAELRWIHRRTYFGRPFSLVAGISFELQDSARRGYENFAGGALGVRGALRRDEDNRIDAFDQYLQVGWDFSERWHGLLGLRRNTVRFRSEDHFIAPDNPDDSGRVRFKDLTPVAGLSFRAAPRLRFHAAFGEGFDSPTFAELAYPPSGASGLNTALRPAKTRSGEFGAKWRFGEAGLLNSAVFLAQTRDEIVVVTAAGGRSSYQNAGRARRQGLEIELSAPIGRSLHAQLAWTLLDAQFREAFQTCAGRSCPSPNLTVPAGQRVPGVAQSNLYSALHWQPAGAWQLGLDAHWLGAVPVNSNNDEFAPAHVLFGLDGAYLHSWPKLRLRSYLRLGNLLDQDHVGSVIVNDANGRYYEPGPGRSLMAGIDLRWN